VRKSVTLPISLWDAINEARKGFPGQVPSEAEAVRLLLREALDAVRPAAAVDDPMEDSANGK
jgi:hypothetical protein